MRQNPRRQTDRGHERLAMARRHADDLPFCLACRDGGKDLREKFEVLVVVEAVALVQHRESLHREGQELGLHEFLGSAIHRCYSLEESIVAAILPRRLVGRWAKASTIW